MTGTPQTRKTDTGYYVEFSFAPSIQLVTIVRRFVGQFFDYVQPDPEMTSKLAVAVHELLENAVKFSTDKVATIRVVMDETPENRSIRITTRNQAKKDHIEILRQHFGEMRNSTTPMDFYVTLMERSAERTDGSQLGLGRVYAETGMLLDWELKDDGTVLVHAVASLEEQPS